ncbi:MAG TPA: type II toxin-antitoxin system RelE/ParE family toxin [Rhizomicrobium sp.]|jgi:putative addiction module killer protein|nr:type II toxin-antitoxin system RelE/ParE family toxin [Rhizomicrobium sp.]
MFEVRETTVFRRWLDELSDANARLRVNVRIRRLAAGNAGDAKSVGGGISELRIDYGPGYRVYFARRGRVVILLLTGGDKRSQWKDISAAKKLAEGITE